MLVLKSVSQLFGYKFSIPAYQRGYRWKETQVKQLLEDIWRFAKNPQKYEPGEEKPFYCLQPVVVKRIKDNEYEVIDGQQRLTTLFLVLKKLQNLIETSKNFFEITYEIKTNETKTDDRWDFLKNVENKTKDDAEQNVDYWHIWQAYQTILKWFKDKADNSGDATPSASIAPSVLNDVKVIWYIWYETSEDENEDKTNDPIDVFARLNIGKIPLTNAELIKALFLQKGNFTGKEETTLKQIQIASEWDTIEKTLQDDDFWFFIYNPENPLKYDNRIEYIFDLMKGRTKESEYYHTFNEFLNDFSKYKKDDKPDIDANWLIIKKYFLTFEEWFKDYELFHYIGYLIACIDKDRDEIKHTKNIIKTINSLKDKSSEITTTKKKFKEYLKGRIKKQVEPEIDNLNYQENKNEIRKILLLFNIQTILETQKSDMRFPFHKYKSEVWHIEHVRSQNDKEDTDKIEANPDGWIDDIFDYFVGSNDEAKICDFVSKSDISNDSENIKDIKEICRVLLDYRKEADKNLRKGKFNSAYNLVRTYFKESEKPDDINLISNLALLDATTNCSYGNAFFPIKRKRIINNDKNGIFVPICTKNLFLKYYSKKLGEVMYWKSDDACDYLQAIKETLKEFLPKDAKPIGGEESLWKQ